MKKQKMRVFDRSRYGELSHVPGALIDTYVLRHDGPDVCHTCIIGKETDCLLPIGTARFIVPKKPGRGAELRVLNTNCEWLPPTESTIVEGLWKALFKEANIKEVAYDKPKNVAADADRRDDDHAV